MWLATLYILNRKLVDVKDAFNIKHEAAISSAGVALFTCENKRRPTQKIERNGIYPPSSVVSVAVVAVEVVAVVAMVGSFSLFCLIVLNNTT